MKALLANLAEWDWASIITAIVALYGAVLSTYNLMAERRARRPQVRVRVYPGRLTYDDGGLSEDMLFLEAANVGLRPVTLAAQGFRLPRGEAIISPRPEGDARFPHELVPGRSCRIWMSRRAVADEIQQLGYAGTVVIIGEYDLPTGEVFKSKPFKFVTVQADCV